MRIVIPLVALLLVSGLARADDCQESSPELTLETPAGTYYVDNELCQVELQCLFSIWIYMESNGQPGLQRGDAICNDDGTCCDADTIIL